MRRFIPHFGHPAGESIAGRFLLIWEWDSPDWRWDRCSRAATGRDHHPHGFTMWLAGGGVKGGTIHGATDELGFHAIEHPHYVTDIHATVMHLLGVDTREARHPRPQAP